MRLSARCFGAGVLSLLAACQMACPLPGQVPMTALKLYFGRNNRDGLVVTDQAWADFAATVLTPAFPGGFTTYAATGQWRDPKEGSVGRQRSQVVEVVGAVSAASVGQVVTAYRRHFHQEAVGQVTEPVCGAF